MKTKLPREDHYAVRLNWSDDDSGWVAEVPALPGCLCVCDTREAAVAEIRVLIRGVLKLMAEEGHALPEPDGGLDEIRRLLPIVSISKLARVSGVSRSTLASRLARGTPMPQADAVKVRRAVAALVSVA